MSMTPIVAWRFFAVASIVLLATAVLAEPYIPEDDALVLERLPAAGAARELEPLRRAVRSNPRDVRSALQLAEAYLRIGRETSDPRFVSYAQATLTPWVQQTNPSSAVLVLQATALQSLHRFDEALVLLRRALTIDPRNSQAWLTKATVLQVQGELAAARAACRPLVQSAGHALALACLASVDSMMGRLQVSYEALQRVAPEMAGAELRSWVYGQLGEMAVRLGDFGGAKPHFEDALRLAPDDAYLRAAHADLLLLENRYEEAMELLKGDVLHDGLLLRLAIAARRAGAPDAERWAQMFDARRRATRSDDNPHLREHARFLLDVLNEPQEALSLARRNWRTQREPADVRLYLRAAQRVGSTGDVRRVQEWVRETGYEDRTLLDVLPNGTSEASADITQ